MIDFGPDGFLYIGLGDGGSRDNPDNRAQDIEELLGKILRIDVDHPLSASQPYSSPPTNPFVGRPGRDEIFALGFRNPWRFSFDRKTGELYVANVGEKTFEEIDLVTLGGNYGWRVFEGTHCTDNDPELCGPARLHLSDRGVRNRKQLPLRDYGRVRVPWHAREPPAGCLRLRGYL